jgi:hypothetical protein
VGSVDETFYEAAEERIRRRRLVERDGRGSMPAEAQQKSVGEVAATSELVGGRQPGLGVVGVVENLARLELRRRATATWSGVEGGWSLL